MNINILCQKCDGVLTDKFSCDRASLIADGTYQLEMECCKCGTDVNITLTIVHEPIQGVG